MMPVWRGSGWNAVVWLQCFAGDMVWRLGLPAGFRGMEWVQRKLVWARWAVVMLFVVQSWRLGRCVVEHGTRSHLQRFCWVAKTGEELATAVC